MQYKFSHFVNTVFTLRIYAGIVKECVAKSFVQNHLDLYARFMQLCAIPKRLDFQKIMLPDREKCRRVIPGL